MIEWQPIETAPKNDTPILVINVKFRGDKRPAVAVWHFEEHYIIEENGNGPAIGIFPTHWMPLPEPPK